MQNFTAYPGIEVSIEPAIYPGSGYSLMFSVGHPADTLAQKTHFWLEMSSSIGGLLGWLHFDATLSYQNRIMFVANQWRPAHDPAPDLSDVLLPRLVLPKGVNADDL